MVKTKVALNKKVLYPRCGARALNENIDRTPNTQCFKERRTRAFSHDAILEDSTVLSQTEQNESIRFTYETKIRHKLNIVRRNKGFMSPVVLRTKVDEMCSLPKFTSPRHYVNELAQRQQKE